MLRFQQIVVALIGLLVLAPLALESQASVNPNELATAVVEAASVKHTGVLRGQTPLLLDSTAMRRAMPERSAAEVAKAYLRGPAMATSRAEAITCRTQPPSGCSIVGNGMLVSVESVESVGDSATAEFSVRWVVPSTGSEARPGSSGRLVWKKYRVHLVRSPQGWSVVSTKLILRT